VEVIVCRERTETCVMNLSGLDGEDDCISDSYGSRNSMNFSQEGNERI
jgi:hypothetical protein